MAIKTNLTGDALIDFRKKRSYRTRFMNEMHGVFLCGYQNKTCTFSDRQCMFRASKENEEIVSGVSKRLRYEYHLIKMSSGKMDLPQNVTLAYNSEDEGVITFTAPVPIDGNWYRQAYIVQYNASKREGRMFKMTIHTENVGLLFSPGENTYGDEIRYWLFIASEDESSRSDSIYLGQIKPLSN